MNQFSLYKYKNINSLFTKIVFSIVLILSSVYSYTQNRESGFPFVENFPPKVYGYESQNYSLIEDKKGILYVGNLSGVLEFDGNAWSLLPTPGIPRFSLSDSGRIYVGSYNLFGYINRNRKNKSEIISLTGSMPAYLRRFGEISNMVCFQDEVLFTAENRLFRFKENKISLLDSSTFMIDLFKVENRVYITKYPGGIFLYTKGLILPVAGNDYFSEKQVEAILPYGENLLIRFKSGRGFVIYSTNGQVVPFYTEIDDFLNKNRFTCAIPVTNRFFAFGTERAGIVLMDMKGKYVINLNDKTGLINDHIHNLYLDAHSNLWIGLNNGISRTEIPSAFTFLNRNSGVQGGISDIIRYRNTIYLASTRGVYYYKPDRIYDSSISDFVADRFVPVTNLVADCNRFLEDRYGLLVSSSEGIFLLKEGKVSKITSGSYESMIHSVKYPDVIYLAGNTGLSCLLRENGKFVKHDLVEKLNEPIRTLAEERDGTLWLGSDFSGTIKVMMNIGWSVHPPYIVYSNGHGLPGNFGWMDVYATSDGILYSTLKGVYRFDAETDYFSRDSLLGLDFSKNDRWIFPLVEDNNKNIWFSSGIEGFYSKETSLACYNGPRKKYTLIQAPFKKIKDYTIESIFPDSMGILWLGSIDGLIRFDPGYFNKKTNDVEVTLRQVVIGNDSVVFCQTSTSRNMLTGKNDTIMPVFKYRYNHINFDFSAPYYESHDEVYYQYYLQGFEKSWSAWEKKHVKEYTNLSEGNYVFHVRARNVYGYISKEAVFAFRIKPPIFRTWYAMLIYIVLLASFIVMLLKWRAYLYAQEKFKLESLLAERTEELVKQKERAEELIANILPKDTAEELASKGHATRKKYRMVTVLFSDVQGFTQIAEHMNPEKLLDELDKFFLKFDQVVERLGIEKIKTIGDAYMCAGGIPQNNRTNPIDVVMAAIEMQQYMSELRSESENEWDIRIGVHTGPVIAGVVGSKKFSYDIWGDTVNIASRMESSGMVGEINISETTHELVQEYFLCEYRGKLPVKHKGEIGMYFVKGIKPEYSEEGAGKLPNHKFFVQRQFIIFDDLEEFIMLKLDKGLPKNLYYHNIKHTIDVMVQAEIFGLGEGVTREEMLLLKTAALFHDTGFLIGYDDHELLSIKMARDILPQYHYTEKQIQIISELIFATKFPPNPRNKLEMIICDADLDYLGRNDFIPTSQNLFRELYERGKITSIDEWNKMQYDFIRSHKYYTSTAQKMRNVYKQMQLDDLNSLI